MGWAILWFVLCFWCLLGLVRDVNYTIMRSRQKSRMRELNKISKKLNEIQKLVPKTTDKDDYNPQEIVYNTLQSVGFYDNIYGRED